MKNYLPFIVLGIGLIVFGAVGFFVLKGKARETPVEEEGPVSEISFPDRPFTSLTPGPDGHWLKLKVENIKVANAESLDYELLYSVKDGRPDQGVPGTIKLKGQKSIERDLLLGTESSGNFRYDQGVEEGTLTIRLRNTKGRLVGKLVTNFHIQFAEQELTSSDGKFSYTLDTKLRGGYFLTMETFGLPEPGDFGTPNTGPYGIFTSEDGPFPGTVSLAGDGIQHWDGSGWNPLSDSESPDIGIFVSASSE